MEHRPRPRRRLSLMEQLRRENAAKPSRPCVAVVTESATEPGKVFYLGMACPTEAACPRCTDARARLRTPPPAPQPKPLTEEDRLRAGTHWTEEEENP